MNYYKNTLVCYSYSKALSLPAAGAAPAKKDLSAYKGVWAFIEISDDGKTQKVRPVGFELLSKGRELADQLGEELCAVIIGDGVEKYFAELSSYGADKIYAVSGPAYRDYNTAAYANAMVALIKKYNPSVVLYPSTYIGRDLSPRISSELFVGLTADCTGLSIADGLLIQTRPAFGGNIMADIKCPDYRPQMSTVRPNVFKKVVTRPGSMAQIVNETIAVPAEAGRVRIISKHFDETSAQDKLDEAEVVIAGGRGMKDKAGFDVLEQLAAELGGAVGASRAAIDLEAQRKTGRPVRRYRSGQAVCGVRYFRRGAAYRGHGTQRRDYRREQRRQRPHFQRMQIRVCG